jgi:hypothetical protein
MAEERVGDRKRRLSRWFVSNQKREDWDEKQLNSLHIAIVFLLFIMHTCHVVASPFLKFIQDDTAIVVLRIIEIISLLIAIVFFVKMIHANSSWAATKMLFAKESVSTYIYIFWILRSFIIEILKGQIVFSFIHIFHSILIYSSDTWYLCNQKALIVNILMFVLSVVYEFLISISPVSPMEPSWTFMNIKTTANSLSRSNHFNLFVIFFHAFLVVVFDPKRSTYVMLERVCKRDVIEMSIEETRKLSRLWKLLACLAFSGSAIFVSSTFLPYNVVLYNALMVLSLGPMFVVYFIIVKMSSNGACKTIYKLLKEINVVFVLILLGILFYIDNIYFFVNAAGLLFPIMIICYIVSDIIVSNFPRRLSKFLMVLMVLILSWNIFNTTFLKTDCEEKKLQWGVFGEFISYCTIKRLIYQTILSLMIPAMIATIKGRIDDLYYINANLYRTTGTIDCESYNDAYVASRKLEKQRSKKKNTAGATKAFEVII